MSKLEKHSVLIIVFGSLFVTCCVAYLVYDTYFASKNHLVKGEEIDLSTIDFGYRSITVELSDIDYDEILLELPNHVKGKPAKIVNNTITISYQLDYDYFLIINYLKLEGDRYKVIETEVIELSQEYTGERTQ